MQFLNAFRDPHQNLTGVWEIKDLAVGRHLLFREGKRLRFEKFADECAPRNAVLSQYGIKVNLKQISKKRKGSK